MVVKVKGVELKHLRGDYCPTCGQSIKKYPIHVGLNCARVLYFLSEYSGQWVKMEEGTGASIEEQKDNTAYRARMRAEELVYFDLACHYETTKHSGLYQITPLGHLFLQKKHKVPDTLYIRNGIIHGKSEELRGLIDIKGIHHEPMFWYLFE